MSVWGLEGRHSWDGGAVVLGDLSAFPRYKLRRIQGPGDLPEIQDNREPAVGRIGEVARRASARGKTWTYEGKVQDRSLAGLRSAEATLRAAFADLTMGERQMTITPHPSYASGSRFYRARPSLLICGDEQGSPHNIALGYQRDFTLALRLSDPRYYDGASITDETAEPSVAGGTSLPFTLPVVLTASGQSAGSVALVNPGTAPSDPVIVMNGPVTNPRLENTTLGLLLSFPGLTITAGSFVTVDFGQRTILAGGTSDVALYLDVVNSDWWDADQPGLAPGTNVVRYTGDGTSSDSLAEVTFNPAYW